MNKEILNLKWKNGQIFTPYYKLWCYTKTFMRTTRGLLRSMLGLTFVSFSASNSACSKCMANLVLSSPLAYCNRIQTIHFNWTPDRIQCHCGSRGLVQIYFPPFEIRDVGYEKLNAMWQHNILECNKQSFPSLRLRALWIVKSRSYFWFRNVNGRR